MLVIQHLTLINVLFLPQAIQWLRQTDWYLVSTLMDFIVTMEVPQSSDFQLGMILSSRRYLAMSRVIFHFTARWGNSTSIQKVEARDSAKQPTIHRTAPNNRAPNVNCTEVEKSCLRVSIQTSFNALGLQKDLTNEILLEVQSLIGKKNHRAYEIWKGPDVCLGMSK